MFSTVAIIGVGLIGGSLGLEIKRKRLARTVIGFGRRRANLKIALRRKLIDQAAGSLDQAVSQADLILLGAPISTSIAQLKEIARFAKPGALVMDVGSTKYQIVRAAEEVLPAHVHFVGAHPMAGTEKAGAAAALPGLFRNKKCLLTPTSRTSSHALRQAQSFWRAMGTKVLVYSPKDHDTVLAIISHLPQMAAYALMAAAGLILEEKEIKTIAGSGFRDTTRIAASPAEMWRDICLTNADSLAGALKVYRKEIERLITWVEARNGPALKRYFERAACIRKKIS